MRFRSSRGIRSLSRSLALTALALASTACVVQPPDGSPVEGSQLVRFAGYAERAGASVRVLARHPMLGSWLEVARVRAASVATPGLGLFAWSHPGVEVPTGLWEAVEPFAVGGSDSLAVQKATLQIRELGSSIAAQLTFTEEGMDCLSRELSRGTDPLQAGYACSTGDRIELFRTEDAEVVAVWGSPVSTDPDLAFEGEWDGTVSVALPILADPGHDPLPATSSCTPTVYMWLDPVTHENVFFDDEPFTVHYSVDCATSLTVYRVHFASTQANLDAAIGGYFLDDGGSGAFYRDAAAAGVLRGSFSVPARAGPGRYSWTISAGNALNPSRPGASETASWTIVESPRMEAGCDPYRACIREMVRHTVPGVPGGITANEALDSSVQAFEEGVLDRRITGLRLERELELLRSNAIIECTTCADGAAGHYYEDRPEKIFLDFCGASVPHDYALLHELTHKIGFDSRLVRAMIDAGVWPNNWEWGQYKERVESMTAEVAGAAYDRSRDCHSY